MRPLVLEMNAFGPFKDTVEIDFTAFDQSSLFLLTGPTGSGKTTIFDAISYVLYGTASGQEREEDTLKSHYATDESLCYVKLKFLINDKTVEVYRKPKQMAPGKRGTPIQHQSEFNLTVDGELVTSKVKESKEEIESLLGLTADQFTQIVMLPQGEFRKLLTSNSKDKEAIFRNIFKTDLFKAFEERLADHSRVYVKKNETLKNKLDNQVDLIIYEDHERLTKAIDQKDYSQVADLLKELNTETKKEVEATDRQLDLVKKERQQVATYVESLIKLDRLNEIQKQLDEQKSDVEATKAGIKRGRQAKELTQVNDRLQSISRKLRADQAKQNDYQQQLQTINNDLTDQNEKLNAHALELDKIEGLEASQKQFEAEIKLWDDLDKAKNKMAREHKQISVKEKEIQEYQDQVGELRGQLKILNQQLEQIPKLRDQESAHRQEIDQLQAEKRDLVEKINRTKDILKDQKHLAERKEDLKNQSQQASDMAKEAMDISKLYYGNLAGVLADQLNDQAPCPVCGSTNHPNKANHSDQQVSREDFVKVDEKYQVEKRKQSVIESQVADLDAKIQEKLAAENLSETDPSKALNLLQEKAADLDARLKTCEENLSDLNKKLSQETEWRKQYINLDAKERQVQAAILENTSEVNYAKKQVKEAENQIQTLSDQLTADSKDDLQKKIMQIASQIKTIRQLHDEYKGALSKLEKDHEGLTKLLEVTSANIDQHQKDMADEEKTFKDLLDKYQLDKDYQEYLVSADTLKSWEDQVSDFEKKVIQTETNLKLVAEKLPAQKDRLSLETYQEQQEDLGNRETALSNKRDELKIQLDRNQSAEESIRQNLSDQAEILEKASIYKELSDLASGKDSANNKISFERYVLGVYFDEVLYAANHRLSQMTEDRYELQRQRSNYNLRSGNGLDLEVFDKFTGRERSVKSLSGGEMFKASLALALGLSDVIQNQLGGVEVNTLFIDEGFGTLDADSLDQAVQVLMELNQTGRLVGIISHVDELKARIPSKLVIHKDQEGSQVKVVK